MDERIERLYTGNDLPDDTLASLIDDPDTEQALAKRADEIRQRHYGKNVYLRGLIEFTNYCANDCYYCGIRASNHCVERYRLDKKTILSCCDTGYTLGFRTFVLQGGEDPSYTDYNICDIVSAIKDRYPYCAVTLSVGEKPYQSYQDYFKAGADRYLLRHETANPTHYALLHPEVLSFEHRKKCLWNLKTIGFQVGAGFMAGAPFQTTAHLVEDLRFLQALQPDMIGMGPFIPHRETPFAAHPAGDLHLCLRLISILRLIFPYALIPSTTAMGTVHPQGREWGLQAGANVVMPNLSPLQYRKQYTLYDNKINTGEEAAEFLDRLTQKIQAAGYEPVTHIGHAKRPPDSTTEIAAQS